jgi:hypothetical protein
LVQEIPRMMSCINTDLPLPVDPAINVCGALVRGDRNNGRLSYEVSTALGKFAMRGIRLKAAEACSGDWCRGIFAAELNPMRHG